MSDTLTSDHAAKITCLHAAYKAERSAWHALWPRGDENPSPADQALIAAGSARLREMHEAMIDLQPTDGAGLRAMAQVFLMHAETNDDGEPVSDRDRPLLALALAVLAVVPA